MGALFRADVIPPWLKGVQKGPSFILLRRWTAPCNGLIKANVDFVSPAAAGQEHARTSAYRFYGMRGIVCYRKGLHLPQTRARRRLWLAAFGKMFMQKATGSDGAE